MIQSEIDKLQSKQRVFFNSKKTLSIEFRQSQLKKLKSIIISNELGILKALNKDLMKNEIEAYVSEINFVINEIDLLLKKLTKWTKKRYVSNNLFNFPSKSYYEYSPFGLSLIISPWNYPFTLSLTPLVGSIASGNCVILKPSELSSNTSKILTTIINDNFPEEYVHVIQGDGETSKSLINKNTNHIMFTGSNYIGQKVYESASKFLIPVILELGGKNPCIVDSNIDIQVTIKRILMSKFINAGQTCLAPDYLLIHESIKNKFITELKKMLIHFYGDEAIKSKDYGRIINDKHFDRLISIIDNEKVIFGGKYSKENKFIGPTLCENMSTKDEIFGPILPIIAYNDLELELSKIDSPLSIYFFSKDKNTIDKVIKSARSGGVVINGAIHGITNHNLPFGGVSSSGIGKYQGKSSIEAFSYKKSVMKKSFKFDNSKVYPPYSITLETFKKVLRIIK